MSHQHPTATDAADAAARRRIRYASQRYPRVDRENALWTIKTLKAGEAPTLRHILIAVEEATCTHLDEIVSPCRKRPVCRARQMYYWLARRLTKQTTTTIGRICAGRDHATVLHGIGRVNGRRDLFEPELSRLLEALTPPEEGPQ